MSRDHLVCVCLALRGPLCLGVTCRDRSARCRTSRARAHRASLERLSSSWRSSLVESGRPGFASPGTLRPRAFSRLDALLLDRACSACFIRAPPTGFKERGGSTSLPRCRQVAAVAGVDHPRIVRGAPISRCPTIASPRTRYRSTSRLRASGLVHPKSPRPTRP